MGEVDGDADGEVHPAPRRRRRAVGPPGARPSQEPDLDLAAPAPPPPAEDDERLRRDVPPHHGPV